MRKRACLILSIIVTSILSLVFASVLSVGANADSINDGTLNTYKQKMWYSALSACIDAADAWRWQLHFLPGGGIDSWKRGDWFTDLDGEYALKSLIGADDLYTYRSGSYVERMVGGGYNDGKIYCGEQGNKLVAEGLKNLSVTTLDVACNYKDGYKSSGVAYIDSAEGVCSDRYNDGSEMLLNTLRTDYFKELITDKTFGGNVPGGNLLKLTNLEEYYANKDAFESICVSGNPHFGNSDLAYQVMAWNPDSGQFEKAGYTQKEDGNYEVWVWGNKKSCQELADSLNEGPLFDAYKERMEHAEEYKDIDPGVEVGYAEGGQQTSGGSDTSACYDGSGALGWILCPVIDSINNIGGWMWKNVIEYHLQIPASGVFESGGAVEQAWGIMRNIANVAFIILFLIVIFSQLTGVGIDNYGIKKILPRLIVVAILVNLSYIICELAVDLSNILGMGLNEMLSGFAKFTTGLSADPNLAAGTLDVALGVGGVGLFALLSNPAGWGSMAIMAATIGVMVLGIVLAMLVAVVVLYLILIIREAGIILLIILAPVAMVCYMLPNTEKLYKKWFDLFKALLIVYPICGMIIGAGKLAGSVLASIGDANGSVSLKIAAMVVQVLPFFLIPKLLKSSLALMGDVGAKLSGMGKRLGAKGTAKVEGAIKGSERFKNLSQFQQDRTAANRARRVQTRLRRKADNGNTLSAREQDRLRRADDTVLAWESRKTVNERRTSEQSYAARQAAIATEDEKARVADYESLIENGRAYNNGGSLINVNDPNSVGMYHAEALARYEAAISDTERSEAMSQIKAAQNILSKTDKGRAQVQNNLAAALQAGQVSGLSGASAHLMSNFGDTYKNKNRGAHAMIQDMATTNMGDAASLSGLQTKLTDGSYAFAGTNKYTAETLAGADDAALDKFVDGVTNGSLTGNELANIQATAYEALQKAKSGTLNIKPEVSQKLEQIVGNNYTPKVVPNSRATVLSHGAYEDPSGNVAHLREMSNGKYLDDGGFEVDITHYKRR